MSESVRRHERHETQAHTSPRSTRSTWSTWGRTALAIALGIGMAGAVVRAGTTKFWEKRKALSLEMKGEQERLGLAGRAQEKALYAQYPTPEIGLCKPLVAAPGATVPVTVNGKFSEKTTFLVANDQVELAAGTRAAGRYTAKATIAADASIGFAPIYAIQKEQENFGCSTLTLVLTGPTPTGRVTCGKNVGARGELKLTGTSTNAP